MALFTQKVQVDHPLFVWPLLLVKSEHQSFVAMIMFLCFSSIKYKRLILRLQEQQQPHKQMPVDKDKTLYHL